MPTAPRDPEVYAPKEPFRHPDPWGDPNHHPLDLIAFGVEAIGRGGAFARPFAADLERLVAMERGRLDANGDPRKSGDPDACRPCAEAGQLAHQLWLAVWRTAPRYQGSFRRRRDLEDGLFRIEQAEKELPAWHKRLKDAATYEAARRLLEQAKRNVEETRRVVEETHRAVEAAVRKRDEAARARAPQSTEQPTVAALRAMEPQERRDALIGRPSRAHSRRMAQRGLAMGLRLIAGGVKA